MLLQVQLWNQPDLLLASTDLRKWHRVAVQSHFNKGNVALFAVVPRLFTQRPYPSISPVSSRALRVPRVHAATRDASSPRGSASHLIPEQRVERDLQEATRGGQDGTGGYYFHSSADSAALLEESLSSAGSGMRDGAPASEALMLICCCLTWIRARGGISFLCAACTVRSHRSVGRVGITRPSGLSRLSQTTRRVRIRGKCKL